MCELKDVFIPTLESVPEEFFVQPLAEEGYISQSKESKKCLVICHKVLVSIMLNILLSLANNNL